MGTGLERFRLLGVYYRVQPAKNRTWGCPTIVHFVAAKKGNALSSCRLCQHGPDQSLQRLPGQPHIDFYRFSIPCPFTRTSWWCSSPKVPAVLPLRVPQSGYALSTLHPLGPGRPAHVRRCPGHCRALFAIALTLLDRFFTMNKNEIAERSHPWRRLFAKDSRRCLHPSVTKGKTGAIRQP
jgi:hypothetical protein